jgi:hypothetical protein
MQTRSNIVSLDKHRGRVAKQNLPVELGLEDNRSEIREISGERLFVQITQSSEKELIGKTMACRAIDASAHGIKFLADDFIPVGCLLDLWVDDKSHPGKFFLSGDVRWTQKAGKISTLAGVRLQDGLATDIENWKGLHSF